MAAPLHIVIARYSECLDWLSHMRPEHLEAVIIYNKGKPMAERERFGIPENRVVALPNIGRESHTFLTHILSGVVSGVASRAVAAERTIFLQGRPFDHLHIEPCDISRLIDVWCAAIDEHGITQNSMDWFGHPVMTPDWTIDEWCGPLDPTSPATLGPWMQTHIGLKAPPSPRFVWFKGACFGVSMLRMAGRDRAYYQHLLELVSSPNPVAGHFMERSWWYVLTNA